MPTTDPSIEHINLAEPVLTELQSELDGALTDSAPYLDQYRFDYETRFCLWEGQVREGRKLDSQLGGKGSAKPWDRASDVRTFTADEIVLERVETMMTAWRRATPQITARHAAALDWSTKATQYLQWLLRDLLPLELDSELELAAQWRETYGVSALGIWWDQERLLEMKEITLDTLIEQAMQARERTGDDAPIEAVQQIIDPLQEEAMIERMLALNPVLDRQGARKFLRNLRENGAGQFPRITIGKNQPCVEALRLFLDVIVPIETSSFAKGCRWTARRRWLTESDLKQRALGEGWDEEWIAAALPRRGRAYGPTESLRNLAPHNTTAALGGGGLTTSAEAFLEVFDHIYTGLDKRSGMPVLVRTVWTPHVPELYAKHEIIPYAHRRQPYIELVRERVERPMAESRSVPEIASTFQNTIKNQRDAENDLAQMTTIPTLVKPLFRGGEALKIGPGAQITERTPGELRFLNTQMSNGAQSRSVEENAEIALARYFGRPHEQVAPARTQTAVAHLVGKFLGEATAAVRMMFELSQQYMDEVQAERVVGAQRVPLKLSREELQGAFSLKLVVDPNDLNFEMAMEKLKAFNTFVFPVDTQGLINRAAYIQRAARAIDPDMADVLVGEPETAAQSEVEDEKKNLVMILSGVEPPMMKEGQNYRLRGAVLMQQLQANPILPMLIAQRPDAQAMLQARMKHLEFMAEQFGPNAEIGRVGAEPGLQQLQEGTAA